MDQKDLAQAYLALACLVFTVSLNLFLFLKKLKNAKGGNENESNTKKWSYMNVLEEDEERKDVDLSAPLLEKQTSINAEQDLDDFFEPPFVEGSFMDGGIEDGDAQRQYPTELRKEMQSLSPKPSQVVKGNAMHWMKQFLASFQAACHALRAIYFLAVKQIAFLPTGGLEVSGVLTWMLYVSAEHWQHTDLHTTYSAWAMLGVPGIALANTLLQLISDSDAHLSAEEFLVWDVVLLALMLVLELYTVLTETPRKRFRTVTKEWRADLISFLHLSWMWPIISKGSKGPLAVGDLPELVDDDQAVVAWKKLSKVLERTKLEREEESASISLTKNLYKMLGGRVVLQGVFALLSALTTFVSPLALREVVDFVTEYEGGGVTTWVVACAVSMFASSAAMAYCDGQMFKLGRRIGIRARSALIQSVYRKALELDMTAANHGQLQNLISVDVEAVLNMLVFQQWMWSTFLRLFSAIILLFFVLGPSAVAGVVLVLLTLPVNRALISRLKIYQTKLMALKDSRMSVINETLNGIRIIKFFGWEENFMEKVAIARQAEVMVLKLYIYLMAGFMVVVKSSPTLVGFVTFIVHTKAFGHDLTASAGFTAITLFQQLRMPLLRMPDTFNYYIQAKVALKRIEKFLLSKKEKIEGRYNQDNNILKRMDQGELFIDAGEFRWRTTRPTDPSTLQALNLHVQPGKLVCVYGPTGSGKSSLLLALLKELITVKGNSEMYGTISYASQQAWIQNATLRDNILFGKPFNPEQYNKVIEACALKRDLEILESGDMTEIGEKGVNLSGGQQQRVSLARAVYANSDIFLLDDVLSAVDAHVGEHIFAKCIKGMLATKTRILITHQVSMTIKHADYIVILGSNGQIEAQGTFSDLSSGGSNFKEYLFSLASEDLEEAARRRTTSMHLEAAKKSRQNSKKKDEAPKTKGKRIIEDERYAKGHVPLKTYLFYFKACGGLLFLFFFVFLSLVWQGAYFAQSFYLSDWIEEMSSGIDQGPKFRLFVIVCISTIGALFARSIAIAFGSLRASRVMHDSITKRVFYAPISWFDSTPLGRIFNRFSSDIETVDKDMMNDISSFVDVCLAVLGVVGSISLSIPWMTVGMAVITAVSCYLGHVYLLTARQLKRLEATSKSPLYAHFSESLSGAATIRAFQAEKRFIRRNAELVDTTSRVHFHLWSANVWLATRIRMLGALVSGLGALFIIIFVDSMDGNTAGLVLSFASQFAFNTVFTLRLHAQMEMSVNSIERAKEYCEIAQEAPPIIPGKSPDGDWPAQGKIEVRDLVLKYASMQNPVLHGISFVVPPMTRVGVVGRTGAGKSSLMTALFRMVEPLSGRIIIDGVDIGTIGLRDLRQKLAIIPQEPMLFSGTIRSNVDPFNNCSDADIWTALEQVHLKDFVISNPARLDLFISDNGQNLSVGQRQLLCMARAILRKSSVLIMDEATANVDPETDSFIQDTMQHQFKACTVLCIAHRLHTVIFYDKILVMELGKIMEYDTPLNLLAKESSHFRSLCEKTGDFDNLLSIAEEEASKKAN